MRSRIDEFAARSAKVVFVGPGTGAMAAEFQAAHAKDHVVLGDPKRVTFGLLSMRRSVGAALHWRFARNLWRAWRGGFRQQGLRGDPWQQGGVCVFEP
ncbi:MAG: AhpC/TSA family protein, partial [Planctomycetota bacterium]